MARPPKEPAQKKAKTVMIRATREQLSQIETAAAAAGQTVSEYTRQKLLHQKPIGRPQSDEKAKRVVGHLNTSLKALRADINALLKERLGGKVMDEQDFAKRFSKALDGLPALAISVINPNDK
jgi:hypothetical protein